MQMYVRETYYQFYTSTPKENAHVTTIVTKLRFVGSHSQVYYHNFHNRLSADFQSRVLLFTKVLPRSLTKPQITTLFYLARLINVIQKHELLTSGILFKAINHPFSKTLLVFAGFFTGNTHHTWSSSLGQPKVNKVKIFLSFWKFMKCPQSKFHAHTMRESQVIRSKKVKIYH